MKILYWSFIFSMSAIVLNSAYADKKAVAKKPSICLKVGQNPIGSSMGKSLTPGNSCCEGLEEAMSKESCGQATGGYSGVCLACGDGRCDKQLENSCNCAKDCANK